MQEGNSHFQIALFRTFIKVENLSDGVYSSSYFSSVSFYCFLLSYLPFLVSRIMLSIYLLLSPLLFARLRANPPSPTSLFSEFLSFNFFAYFYFSSTLYTISIIAAALLSFIFSLWTIISGCSLLLGFPFLFIL